jgi:hypothetical protein
MGDGQVCLFLARGFAALFVEAVFFALWSLAKNLFGSAS